MSETVLIEVEPAGQGDGQPARLKGDLTEGPILRTLLAFSIPTLIANVLQTLNGSINAVWVGRLLGESALAATANANVIMFLLFAAVFGFGMATTVRVGQHFGARDIAAARRTFGAGLGFCVLIAVGVGLAGAIWSPALLHAMATPAASLAEADAYLRVIFVTTPLVSASMMLSMGLRGAGDSRTPLYAMILTVVLDVIFNPLLIRGIGPFPQLGIAGSALSTALANLAGVCLMVASLYWRDLPLRLRGAELRWLFPGRAETAYVVKKGLPMGAQMLLISSAQIVVVGLVNREGLDTTAAYGASVQLWNYLQMPAMAIASAVSAMVAQSVGAGKHGRVRQVTRTGILTTLAFTLTMAGLIIVADRPLLALFLGGESRALPIAAHMQLICTWSFAISGIMMILTGTMRAYGEVILPLVVMAIAFYPARLGFYYAFHPLMGAEALWWSYPVSSAAAVGLTWLAYARGSWRRKALGA
ncbi:MATE family efflux transporter [Novosphingobium flavum]|uniref:MATE family efflux transporter n=1 Tax=Novosphingobium flavum TaxID=1778672 RepID=A0A7X1FN63_9SPHN|nr:MATE family efflux transporter [Novosphingobium flavum]MBC2663895.1 MATE family efflux transporter [Novosphingobium flavum]